MPSVSHLKSRSSGVSKKYRIGKVRNEKQKTNANWVGHPKLGLLLVSLGLSLRYTPVTLRSVCSHTKSPNKITSYRKNWSGKHFEAFNRSKTSCRKFNASVEIFWPYADKYLPHIIDPEQGIKKSPFARVHS
jgi:hypothetical protein